MSELDLNAGIPQNRIDSGGQMMSVGASRNARSSKSLGRMTAFSANRADKSYDNLTGAGHWLESATPVIDTDWSDTDAPMQPFGQYKHLLLVGRGGFIPDCNVLALIHQFPDLLVRHSTGLTEPPADTLPAVLLVEEAYLTSIATVEDTLAKLSRDRIVAVVDEAVLFPSPTIHRLIAQNLIRGVLPMNLRLEVWLLAVNLFARGGEFVPASLMRDCLSDIREKEVEPDSVKRPNASIATLTDRELQVLDMVSSGCSNRAVASRFNLSEHTIKAHVHNIIRKLKAPNRTAAAAMYLENMRKVAGVTNAFA